MKKYVRYIVCFPFTLIKFCLIKLFHMNGFHFHPLELFAINSEMAIGNAAKVTIGRLVRCQSNVRIRARKNAVLRIGDNTAFNNGCVVTCHYNVYIGSGVEFGQNVLIYDHDHDFRAEGGIKAKKYKYGAVSIGDNCWIGANTVILRGTSIGNNSVVGAGCVIKGHYPENSVIVQKRETTVINYKMVDK